VVLGLQVLLTELQAQTSQSAKPTKTWEICRLLMEKRAMSPAMGMIRAKLGKAAQELLR
jgi:hypothetical protein